MTRISETFIFRKIFHDINKNNDQMVVELWTAVKTSENADARAFYLEKMIVHLFEQRDGNDDFISFPEFPEIRETMKIITLNHKIRILYSKQCYIGLVGPQNAGKSTLLNKLLNKNPAYGRHQLSRLMRIVGPIQI